MAKKKRGFIGYRTYAFVDKDPIIDWERTVVAKSGLSYSEIADKSNVSKTTIRNWFHGKTRKPQFATIAAVALACGVRHLDLANLAKNGKQKPAQRQRSFTRHLTNGTAAML